MMSPFAKGALGFIGCAGLFGAAYAIGKHVGREETLKEVELEEKKQAVKTASEQKQLIFVQPQPAQQTETAEQVDIIPVSQPQPAQPTPAENVRKKHGIKNKLFGGVGVIKDLLGGDTDGKQLTMTVEDGDIVARISQKQGG